MGIMLRKKGNMSKYDIIQIILRCSVSKIYSIVMLPKTHVRLNWSKRKIN